MRTTEWRGSVVRVTAGVIGLHIVLVRPCTSVATVAGWAWMPPPPEMK